MTASAVLVDRRGSVCEITLNRPEQRNAMAPELLQAFQQVIDEVKGDRAIRCVVITGSGDNFCSGADFRSALLERGSELPHEASYAIYRPFLSILDVPVPVIAAMNGHAIGGGFGLGLVCDIRCQFRAPGPAFGHGHQLSSAARVRRSTCGGVAVHRTRVFGRRGR
jgi:enoyl-CoA hydratase/carnithine racemase